MKAISSAAIVFINGLLSMGFTPQEGSIAHVTQVQGVVKVRQRAKSERRITYTTLLCDGDTVKTGAGGRAWVYQAYARPEMLKPNVSRTIKRLPPVVGDGLMDADKYAELETQAVRALQEINRRSPGKMGGPDELSITALTPRKSLVLDGRLTFEWTSVKDAKSYEFALYDVKQDKPIWQTTVKEPRAAYPASRNDNSVMPLLPGRYTWEVTANVDQNHRVYDAAEFTVAGAWQTTAVRYALRSARGSVKNKNASNLFYVSACLDLQLYPNAEAELKRVLRRTPSDLMLWALLMQVYEFMGRHEDRNKIIDYLKDSKPSHLEQILGSKTLPQTNRRAFSR